MLCHPQGLPQDEWMLNFLAGSPNFFIIHQDVPIKLGIGFQLNTPFSYSAAAFEKISDQ